MRYVFLLVILVWLAGCLSDNEELVNPGTLNSTTTSQIQSVDSVSAYPDAETGATPRMISRNLSLTTTTIKIYDSTTTTFIKSMDEPQPEYDRLSASVKKPFPEFITPNEKYFTTRIGGLPDIAGEDYYLEVKGLVKNPGNFSLKKLRGMKMIDLPLTVECIGRGPDDLLVSTAIWRGFRVLDFLEGLGLMENATGVRYEAADGYFASHTIKQLNENNVLAALYMNGDEIPRIQGYPLRILNPGFYGVKQPAWVISIEVIDRPLEDYWSDRGWDVSPPMSIDTKIFFPDKNTQQRINETFIIGGASFGGKRVSKVEYSIDGGINWFNASFVKLVDNDNVWSFWEADISFPERGSYDVFVKATDIFGNSQVKKDLNPWDGQNSWSRINVTIS